MLYRSMNELKLSNLAIVSNRGPYSLEVSGGRSRWVRAPGGLVTALDPVLRAQEGVWVYASPLSSRHSEQEHEETPPELPYRVEGVPLSPTDYREYYAKISNEVMWPVLHGFAPTTPVAEVAWERYEKVNRLFAERLLKVTSEDAFLWVHDYHLMLVPGEVRRARPTARISWFCHVPWPAFDDFRILPWRKQILESLLSADILGFHCRRYAEAFLRAVTRLSHWKVDQNALRAEGDGRTVQVMVAPIGIPVQESEDLVNTAAIQRLAAEIRLRFGGRKLILGVDRLDYTKGIVERLRAFDHLLRTHRSMRDECVYLQILVPSRTDVPAYGRLKNEIDQLVGAINARFGEIGHTPVHCLFRHVDRDTLFALYALADAVWVSSLRDGMNLVAQEYVSARTRDDGALVLSEFAGVADYLKEAILVNPYDKLDMERGIFEALRQNPERAQERMKALRASVRALDVHRWAEGCLTSLVELGKRA